MAYTDFIAAIDLGTSHMVGMVGTKNEAGALSIIAYEVENSESCIRRGCVYNIKDTAAKIRRLILKLENKLGNSRIDKVYLGVGGQSLRTMNHMVSRVLPQGIVTQEILNEMYQECKKFSPDMVEVLEIAGPTYYLDNRIVNHPLNLSGNRLEAQFKLIVGRPSLKSSLISNFGDQLKVQIAGILVSPLALSDLILTDPEKSHGCALVDFGAGVTSVTTYKQGELVDMTVIPLGSDLITRDLTSLNISAKEAERLKRTFGNAIWEKDNNQTMITIDGSDGQHSAEVKQSDITMIVEARSREIVENVYERLIEAGFEKEPGFSIVMAGSGSALKNMRELIGERFKMDVRYASVRKDKIEAGEMIANNPEYTTAASLLLKGTENCAMNIPEEPVKRKPEPEPVQAPEPKPTVKVEETITAPAEEQKKVAAEPPRTENPELKKKKPKDGGSIFGGFRGWKNKIEDLSGDLFKED